MSKHNGFIKEEKKHEFLGDIAYYLLNSSFCTTLSTNVFLHACDVVHDFYSKNNYKICSGKSKIREIFMKFCLKLGEFRKS